MLSPCENLPDCYPPQSPFSPPASVEVQNKPDVDFRWAAKQTKCAHTLECYVSLINVLALAYDLEMGEKGCKVPPHAYSLIIGGLCKEGKCIEGYAVFEHMIWNGLKASVVIYTTFIDAFAKCGRMEDALKLLDRMILMGLNQMGHCQCLIDGLGKAGRVDEARKLFADIVVKGCPRDSYCYNALTDALANYRRVNEALALFNMMDNEGCDQTTYTYTILISGLFREHKNEEAVKRWDMMIDKGRIKEACKLADGVVNRGREIPGRIRTALINALRKAANADLAMKLMHSKIGIGYDRVGSAKRRVKFRTLVES
ncbi:hypothetical protein REPUB_Repub01dG0133500 [Reevesia pubescens]